ncbi:MAG: DEAD/DEAH box helicase [Planctomycetes bacterium]|nr:DEAD/DEAH box helicase [Planctomycetota bacterium]
MEYHGLTLDPFQVEALHHLEARASIIVSAPTGSGKTLIAEYAIEQALQGTRRLIYTAPIKALSNQKFRDFSARYGDRVGVVTGDVAINPYAQVLIMTTEIFRNTVFDDAARLHDVEYVIFDEVHFIDDNERGTVWEESLIFAPEHIRFVCLSATVPNLREFAAWLTSIRKTPFHTIVSDERVVPLRHYLFIQGHGVGSLEDLRRYDQMIESGQLARWEDWRKIVPPEQADLLSPRHAGRWRRDLIDHLVAEQRLPALYFIFNRRECNERAMENIGRELLTPPEQERIREMWNGLVDRYSPPDDETTRNLGTMIRRGIAYHHAGMLPTLKEIVERSFTSGLVKLLFATETFALGINMPARTVVLDTLHKFDGIRRSFLKSRDYMQMAGRAGRRGMDEEGFVYGNVEWPFARHEQVERIVLGAPEPLRSQFNLSYATLLNLYQQLGERIFEACEKSFANFTGEEKPPPSARAPKPADRDETGRRRSRRKRPGVERPAPPGPEEMQYWGMVDQVKRRLAVLRDLDYIRDGKLTARGKFASQVYGYELPFTEMLFRGVFDHLSEEQICVTVCAVLFESKRSAYYRMLPNSVLGRSKRAAWSALNPILAREAQHQVRERTKGLDFRLGAAIHSWARGAKFEALERDTSATDGDIVRSVRQTVQFMRQIERAIAWNDEEVGWVVPGAHAVRQRIDRAIRRIKRDVIDAEKQLRMSEEAESEGTAAALEGAGTGISVGRLPGEAGAGGTTDEGRRAKEEGQETETEAPANRRARDGEPEDTPAGARRASGASGFTRVENDRAVGAGTGRSPESSGASEGTAFRRRSGPSESREAGTRPAASPRTRPDPPSPPRPRPPDRSKSPPPIRWEDAVPPKRDSGKEP